jgi:hypothetical protein
VEVSRPLQVHFGCFLQQGPRGDWINLMMELLMLLHETFFRGSLGMVLPQSYHTTSGDMVEGETLGTLWVGGRCVRTRLPLGIGETFPDRGIQLVMLPVRAERSVSSGQRALVSWRYPPRAGCSHRS